MEGLVWGQYPAASRTCLDFIFWDNRRNVNVIFWCVTLFFFFFPTSSVPLPLRDPLAPLPSDHQRLAASNYILRQYIPLRYKGAIPQRALFWMTRVSRLLVLGSLAKLGPGDRCWWSSAGRLVRYDTQTAGGIKNAVRLLEMNLKIARDFLLHWSTYRKIHMH